MFVGKEATGKSSLVEALKERAGGTKSKSTFAKLTSDSSTNDSNKKLMLPTQGIDRGEMKLDGRTVNYWDFSGSLHFMNTHPFFLTERSIYVLTYNINSAFDYGLSQWLEIISYYAPQSPILIVGTHLDLAAKKKNGKKVKKFKDDYTVWAQKHQKRKLGQIKGYFPISNNKPKYLNDFHNALVALLGNPCPQDKNIQPNVLDMSKDILMQFASKPLLSWSQVMEIAKKSKITTDAAVIAGIKYIELLGHTMYFPGIEDKKKRIKSHVSKKNAIEADERYGFVISPKYLNQMFTVIQSKKITARNGRIKVSELSMVWNERQDHSEFGDDLLAMLEYFDILFRLGEDELLIPMQVEESLPNIQRLWPSYDPQVLQFSRTFSFNFLPLGLFSRFMLRILEKLGEANTKYWRYGFIINPYDGLGMVTCDNDKRSITINARSTRHQNPVILFSFLIDFLDALLEHEFMVTPTITMPCCVCLTQGVKNPHYFRMEEFTIGMKSESDSLKCPNAESEAHSVPLLLLAPDLAMFGSKKLNLEEFKLDKVIGEGSFAKVYRTNYNNQDLAVKVLKNVSVAAFDEFRHEIDIMRKLEHNNLLSFVGFSMKEPTYIALEFMDHGDLRSLLDKKSVDSWELKLRLSWDVAAAIEFMHGLDPKLLHCDFKTPNVLVKSLDYNSRCCAKVADFGETRVLMVEKLRGHDAAHRRVANPTWLAPEVLLGQSYGCSSDVYALGIVFWEILTQDQPYADIQFDSEKESFVIKGNRLPIPSACDPEYAKLIKDCWDGDESQRPTAMQVTEVLRKMLFVSNVNVKSFSADFTNASQRPKRPASANFSNADESYQTIRLIRDSSIRRSRSQVGLGWKSQSVHSDLKNRWKPKGLLQVNATFTKLADQILYTSKMLPEEVDMELMTMKTERPELNAQLFNISDTVFEYTKMGSLEKVSVYDMKHEILNLSNIECCVIDAIEYVKKTASIILFYEPTAYLVVFIVAVGVLFNLNYGKLKFPQIINKYRLQMPQAHPSLLRYAEYVCAPACDGLQNNLFEKKAHLHKIVLNGLPTFKLTGGCDPFFAVTSTGQKKVVFSKKFSSIKGKQFEFFSKDITVFQDLLIEFYHKNSSNLIFSVQCNLTKEKFSGRSLVFKKSDIDKAAQDKTSKHFSDSFQIELVFLSIDECRDVYTNADTTSDWTESEYESATGSDPELSAREKKVKSPRKPKRDKDLCIICNDTIEEFQSSLAINFSTRIHTSCQKCVKCGMLQEGEFVGSMLFHEGKLWCPNCSQKFFPSCHLCQDPITCEKKSYIPANVHWHPKCLQCSTCRKQIFGDFTCNVSTLAFSSEDEDDHYFPVCSACTAKLPGAKPKLNKVDAETREEFVGFIQEPIAVKHFSDFLEPANQVKLDEYLGINELLKEPEKSPEKPSTTLERRPSQRVSSPRGASDGVTSPRLSHRESMNLTPVSPRGQILANNPKFTQMFDSQPNKVEEAQPLLRRVSSVRLQAPVPTTGAEADKKSALLDVLVPEYVSFINTPDAYQAYLSVMEQQVNFDEEEDAERRLAMKSIIVLSDDEIQKNRNIVKKKAKRIRDEQSRPKKKSKEDREREERERREREEKERLEREERERLAREERERLEREERERREKEERERREREERERLEREERERKERELLDEEARARREREEKERLERERKEREERERLAALEKERLERERLERDERERAEREARERREREERERLEREKREREERERREKEERERLEREARERLEREQREREEQARRDREERERKEREERERREREERERLAALERERLEEARKRRDEMLGYLTADLEKQKSILRKIEERMKYEMDLANEFQGFKDNIIAIPQEGIKTIRGLGLVVFYSAHDSSRDAEADNIDDLDIKVMGTATASCGSVHMVTLLASKASTGAKIPLPNVDKFLRVTIAHADGTCFVPFFATNEDQSVCLAFFASKVGKVNINVTYRSTKNLQLTSSLEIVDKQSDRDWELRLVGEAIIGQEMKVKVVPLNNTNSTSSLKVKNRSGGLPKMTKKKAEDGSYELTCTPTQAGRCEVDCTFSRKHVLNSPLQVFVGKKFALRNIPFFDQGKFQSLVNEEYNAKHGEKISKLLALRQVTKDKIAELEEQINL